jgi:hypothetical protein
VTLVGVITFLDFIPHCVLEVRETGDGRLQRIYELMKRCRISVHDMSRIGAPVRFNMPFELGLACSLKLVRPQQYEIIVLDSKEYRMDHRLSDYKGHDLFIHRGTCDGMIEAVLDAFPSRRAHPSALRAATRELRGYVRELKRDFRATTIFHPHLFDGLTSAAAEFAVKYVFLAP